MELRFYKPSETEQWIINKYMENGIMRPSDLTIAGVSMVFNTDVIYYDGRTTVKWEEGVYAVIAINENLDENEQRENFFHELGHPVLHIGRQRGMSDSFIELQEEQAGQFQMYAAIPYYMLEEFNDIEIRDVYIQTIADKFKLPTYLVRKRIEQMERKIMIEKYDQVYVRRCKPVRMEVEYTDETNRILEQLHRQLNAKKSIQAPM